MACQNAEARIDAEPDGQPSADALADDNTGTPDDEDGLTATALIVGAPVTVTITVVGHGYLSGWMDWNHDGDWGDAGEKVFSDRSLVAGGNPLTFLVPANATVTTTANPSFARFRFSTQAGLPVTGLAPDGEVEDYQVRINAAPSAQAGGTYREPKLVLFSGMYPTACGMGQSAAGPFYCPEDQKVYIDLSFFRQLQERFRAPGDFAQAYVIAHEVGHHVQNLLGIMEKTAQLRSRMSPRDYNEVSVRVELQADCFAGVWAHHADRMRNVLEPGDLEEALRAATAIGDDVLQKQSQGYVVPDSFTHGSAAQRTRWFRTGFESGSMQACNTFEARQL